jgi:hypothetical protein
MTNLSQSIKQPQCSEMFISELQRQRVQPMASGKRGFMLVIETSFGSMASLLVMKQDLTRIIRLE